MAIASRKLLGAKGLFEMMLLTAPVIITFILFFGDGTRSGGFLPSSLWLSGLIIAMLICGSIHSMLKDKLLTNVNFWKHTNNNLNCGLLKLPFGLDNGLYIPYRLIFYGYTLSYLSLNIITNISALGELSNMIPIMVIIIILSLADMMRLAHNNCYIDEYGVSAIRKVGAYLKVGLLLSISIGIGWGFLVPLFEIPRSTFFGK